MENKENIRLYIADEVRDNELYNYFKNKEGYQVVGNGTAGLQVVKDVKVMRPDFLISEVMLSEIDGFKVFETLKEEMGSECPKVIFVSSLTHSGFVSKAMKEGASYFMFKPIMPENLEERLQDILSPNLVVDPSKVLDERIASIFISIGIPAHIKGYQFLREAVKLAVQEPDMISQITKKLYPTIAEKFETSSSKVERGMRHAIEVAWNRGKIENINNIFGFKVYSNNEKPTNSELIALIADKMIMDG